MEKSETLDKSAANPVDGELATSLSDDNLDPVVKELVKVEGETEKSRGVRRIENVRLLMNNAKNGRTVTIIFFGCLLLIGWVQSLDASTTGNYQVAATSSFSRHSMISTVGIATSIIGSVIQPFQAKFSDITSRPLCFLLSLAFYTVGIIIAAASANISSYVAGSVLTTVGSNGLSFLLSVIVADTTSLQWRGFVNGIMTSPYIITVWFAGLIVDALIVRNWRWGYGMFAVIMPVTVIPPIFVMYLYERKAQKLVHHTPGPRKSFWKVIWDSAIEIDAFGMILMGFGWSLLLLPFTLYSYAKDGWKNPSVIAMLVVGVVILILYGCYEIWLAPFPSMPKRILTNKTFITAVVMNIIYMMAYGIRDQYLSTVVWVGKDWSDKNWTYFNNALTVSLCFFGVIAGWVLKVTHRYKYWASLGILIRIVAYCLPLRKQGVMADTGSYVMCEVLMGLGSAFFTIGTQTSSQAAVPHQDLSLTMALLLVWSTVGGAIGYAISAPIWTSKMPVYMREFLPSSLTDEEVFGYYSDMTTVRELPFDSEIRQGVTKAMSYVNVYFFAPPIAMEFINLLISFMQTNYYLGDTHNAVEDQNGRDPTDPNKEKVEPQTMKEKIRYLFK